jgi:serine/threonine protein kinase
MGYVFLAEDSDLCRLVALKVMRPNEEGDAAGLKRFLGEARIMASLKHAHLVPVFQVGQQNGVIYLAMEYLQGETLETWAARVGQAEPLDLVRIGKQIAAGLQALHDRGVIHRDLKPANVWLEEPDRCVRILDLGLARFVHDNSGSTEPGMIVGTPAFMSPEQAGGDRLDARSDLFGLGAVLYRLATGQLPFRGDTTLAVLTAVATHQPRPVNELNPAVPRSLAKFITRLLAKQPEERPGSASGLIAELDAIEARLLGGAEEGPSRDKPTRLSKSRRRRRVRQRSWTPLARLLVLGTVILTVTLGAALVAGLLYSRTHHVVETKPQSAYLSDLLPTDSVNYWTMSRRPPHEPGPPGPETPVIVHGQHIAHALFTHPPGSPVGGVVMVTYRLEGNYKTFRGQVSVNDGPIRSETPMTFAIYGDGHPLWRSASVSSQRDSQPFDVSIKGVQLLTLQVECAGDTRGAHAVWLNPEIVGE